MNSNYIKYNNKIVKIKILQIIFKNYKVVQTEEGDILGIPPESGTHIYSSYEECDYYENHCCD